MTESAGTTNTTPPVARAPRTLGGVDLRSIWLIGIACAAVSMVVAAMAALNTALPDIAIETGSSSAEMTWIIDGYTLALAALLLPAGAIGDRIGRREVLVVGLVLFAIASLLPVWITDPTQLIATRAFAGAAAALIMPTTLSLITSGVPEDKRAIGVSIWSAVAGVGAIAGFLVTGILLEFFSWKSIFITFAASAAVTAILCVTIGTSKDSAPGPFDWRGALTSVLGIFAVVYGLLEAPHRGWDDPLILSCIIGGLALVALFCVIEIRSAHPLLDVRLFKNRAFGSGALAVSLQFFGSFATFFLFLQQLQLIFGFSPLNSAFALMPMVAGVGVFALTGNWIAVRFHSLRFVLSAGIAVAGLGIILLGVVDYDSYYPTATGLLVLVAVGIGLATAPSTTAIMSNTPLDNQGVGSAVNDTARELGAAIGIALAGSIVAAGYSSRIGDTSRSVEEQLRAAGQQRLEAGDTLGGQMTIQQADQAGEHIGRSLAEATAVAERMADRAPDLAAQITAGAREAFLTPTFDAYVILGSVMVAGAAILVWLAPGRVVEVVEEEIDTPGQPDPDTTESSS